MPADQKPQSATPSGWRDSYPDGVGGWPDLYKRLDALRARIARLNFEQKIKPAAIDAKP